MLKLEKNTTSLKTGGAKLNTNKKKADPLGVEYTGNAEVDSKSEINAVKSAFQERREQEAARFKNATDSEYWVAVCFQSREQKEEFLRALNLIAHGDKYLDGLKVAEALGVELKSPTPQFKEIKSAHSAFTNLIKEVK